MVLECSFTLTAGEKESSDDPKTKRMRTHDFACLSWDCVSSMHGRMFWKSYETSAILHPYVSFVHSGLVCVCVCGICAHVSRAFIGLCDLSSRRKGKGFICLQLFIYLFIHFDEQLISVVGIGKSVNKKKERGKEFFMMITAVLRGQKVIQRVLQTKKEIKKKRVWLMKIMELKSTAKMAKIFLGELNSVLMPSRWSRV